MTVLKEKPDSLSPEHKSKKGYLEGPFLIRSGDLETYLAVSKRDIEDSQRLRYEVFYNEMGADPKASLIKGLDVNSYDAYAEHLIVKDVVQDRVVGTYRLLRSAGALKHGSFYSEGEFDLSKLKQLEGGELLEVSRSCVHIDYRSQRVVSLLWRGLVEYILHYGVTHLFGCGSFSGNDVRAIAHPLSYLYHYHLLPESWRVSALPEFFHSLNYMPKEAVDIKKALKELPPLLKGYMRVGGYVGDGAFVDKEFNTIDVCVVVESSMMTPRFAQYFNARTQQKNRLRIQEKQC